MPFLSLRRMLGASCLLTTVAAGLLGLGGCGAQQDGGRPSTSPSSTPSGGPVTPTPARGATQVYFDPSDLRTPRTTTLLRQPAEVTKFVAWLNTKPRPGMASDRLVATLRNQVLGDNALLVVSRLVGCDSVGAVQLRRQGTNFSLATLNVTHHEECLRANVLVAVYRVPLPLLPANPTIDGATPDMTWK